MYYLSSHWKCSTRWKIDISNVFSIIHGLELLAYHISNRSLNHWLDWAGMVIRIVLPNPYMRSAHFIICYILKKISEHTQKTCVWTITGPWLGFGLFLFKLLGYVGFRSCLSDHITPSEEGSNTLHKNNNWVSTQWHTKKSLEY